MKSKYRKALVVPYFGKFNNYFQLWLISCAYNNDYDWFIYTDDYTVYKYPANVHVTYMNFSEIKQRIQRLFDFDIAIESPYKLCDYRPAYGEIFEDDLKEYDFWGYCDTDLIWGRLSAFYTDEILEKYDKISDAGHFTLYRNNKAMKSAYRELASKDCLDFKEVYSHPKNYAFDEWGQNRGINRILINNGFSIYYKPIWFADIMISSYGLHNTRIKYDLDDRKAVEKEKKHIIYIFDKGVLTQYALNSGKKVVTNEEAYVHLQKRPMLVRMKCKNANAFMIYPPNVFDDMPRKIDSDYMILVNENKIYWHFYQIRFNNLKRKIKNFLKR